MKILMLGRWVPPARRPVRGTREYQFARYLARSHQLTLAFISDNPEAAGAISALRSEFGDLEFAAVPRGWKSLASAIRLAAGDSCTLSYFRSEALRTRLADRVRTTRYDLVFVSASSMIPYALEVDPAIPLVVDFGDLDSEWWRRQAEQGAFPGTRFFKTEATRLRMVEAVAARRAAACLAATAEAAAVIQALAGQASISVVPTGVDLDFLASGARLGKGPVVVFNGSLGDETQIHDVKEFCRTVLPILRARCPGVAFIVASKDPPARLSAIGELEGADVIAAVSDARLFLHDQAVAVAPLWAGTDIRGSVWEPMAAGVPVVATRKACERIGARPGRDLRVADDPVDFALHVAELLGSESLRRELAGHGRRFAAAHFAWDVYAAHVAKILASVVKLPDGATAPRLANSLGAVLNG